MGSPYMDCDNGHLVPHEFASSSLSPFSFEVIFRMEDYDFIHFDADLHPFGNHCALSH